MTLEIGSNLQTHKLTPKADSPDNRDSNNIRNTSKFVAGITLTGLVALASYGIYIATKGKIKPKTPSKTEPFVQPIEEFKLNEEAEKIYQKIDKKLHAKTEINAETIDKNLAPVQKQNSWAKEDIQAYYKKLEVTSAQKAAEDAAKKAKTTIKKIIDEDGYEKLVTLDYKGRKIEERCQILSKDIIDVFNPETGKCVRTYSGGTDFWIKYYDKNEELISEIGVANVFSENFEKALGFVKKYESTAPEEIEKLCLEILNGNPKNISELEFKVIEAFNCHNKKTIPITSELTQIKDHHYIHGRNNQYREVQKPIEGLKCKDDFTREEFKKILEENPDLADKIQQNTRNIETYEQIKKYDTEIAALPPLEKDCIFYRGVSERYIPSIINGKVGDKVIPDKGYAYAAFDMTLAQEFGPKCILTINTPKGARVSRNLEHGGEALFPRNAEYKILSKNKTPDGNWRIELEYILP